MTSLPEFVYDYQNTDNPKGSSESLDAKRAFEKRFDVQNRQGMVIDEDLYLSYIYLSKNILSEEVLAHYVVAVSNGLCMVSSCGLVAQ